MRRPDQIGADAERTVVELLSDHLASADIPALHPVTEKPQHIHFSRPTIVESDRGRELVVLFQDRGGLVREYGYRLRLPEGWNEDTQPQQLAGLVATEILEVIEASTIGLPTGTQDHVTWIDDL